MGMPGERVGRDPLQRRVRELQRRGCNIGDQLALEFISDGTIEGLPAPRNCYDAATVEFVQELIRMPQAERPPPHERLALLQARTLAAQQAAGVERQRAQHELEHHTLFAAMEEQARSAAAGGGGAAPLPAWRRQLLEEQARDVLRQAEASHAVLPRTPVPPLCECGRPDLRAAMAADAARAAEAAGTTPDEREAMNDRWSPLLHVLASEVGQQHVLPCLPAGQTRQHALCALRATCRTSLCASPEMMWSSIAKFNTPASEGGQSLQRLAVYGWAPTTVFSQDDAAALAALTAPALQSLRLDTAAYPSRKVLPWGPGAIRTLVQQGHWPALQELYLLSGSLDAQAVVTLSQGKWPQLLILEFEGTGTALGVRGAAALAGAPWPLLQELTVWRSGVTAKGAAALTAAQWPGLLRLVLARGCMGDAGALALASANWPALKRCLLGRNGISEEGYAALEARWPGVDY